MEFLKNDIATTWAKEIIQRETEIRELCADLNRIAAPLGLGVDELVMRRPGCSLESIKFDGPEGR